MRLPSTAQEIADVIGREQALFLVGQLPRAYKPRNGSNIILYVPKTLNPNDRLVRILGWTDASKLVREFRGMLIHPASCAEVYRPFRDRNIVRLVNEGTPISMVAEWFDVSERTVKNVLAEIPPHERRAANDNNRPIKHDRRKANAHRNPQPS